MAKSFHKLGIFLSLLFLIGSGDASATTLPTRSLTQMIRGSSKIVRARVLDSRVTWGQQKRHVLTEITLATIEALKGDVTPTIRIRQLGGILGGYVTKVPGTANLKVGEEVVLFLEQQRRGGHYLIFGMASGKYDVMVKENQLLLIRHLEGLTFHHPPGQYGSGSPLYHVQYSEKPITLSFLKERIKVLKASRISLPQMRVITPAPSPKQLRYQRVFPKQNCKTSPSRMFRLPAPTRMFPMKAQPSVATPKQRRVYRFNFPQAKPLKLKVITPLPLKKKPLKSSKTGR